MIKIDKKSKVKGNDDVSMVKADVSSGTWHMFVQKQVLWHTQTIDELEG
jgi:hypothetical protein